MSLETQQGASVQNSLPNSEVRGPVTTKGRVLVADDEVAVTRLYEKVLSASGYQVTTVNDGVLARALLEGEDFDVILSDVHMPGMSGIDLLRAARRFEREVPVVLVTGAAEDGFADLAGEFGALLYLIKPVEPRIMVQVVEHAIRLHRLSEPEATKRLRESSGSDSDRAALNKRFTNALGSLRIAFQPIVNCRLRQVFGYEALVRSDEPLLGLPLALLDAAETLGRVRELGRAIRGQIASIIERAPEGVRIFVNLHPEEISDPDLLQGEAPLSLHADRVILEITERASLDQIRGLPVGIAALRKLGFKIAIDDLGAGYSGLTAFASLMPELVKIDMSLVRDLDREPVKRELIRHMASLCTEMGMLAVAEGVETACERDTLVEIGCEVMQGYLFGRPMQYFQTVEF